MAMTDNEAIYIINKYIFDFKQPGTFKMMSALQHTTKSLEEIRQYRSIGTVDECKKAMERQRLESKLGKTVYRISKAARDPVLSMAANPVIPMKIYEICLFYDESNSLVTQIKCRDKEGRELYYSPDDIGKNVFLTRQDADMELKERFKQHKH